MRLSTLGLIPNNQYSVALLFEFDTISSFRKILDFLNRTSDTGFYNLSGVYDFFGAAGDGVTSFSANQYIQTVFTRDASGQVSAYLDGNQEFSFNDGGNLALISGSAENFLYFFRDDLATGDSENSGGSVARIRLFDDALTPAEVAALDTLPIASTPEPSSLIALLGLGGLGLVNRLKKQK